MFGLILVIVTIMIGVNVAKSAHACDHHGVRDYETFLLSASAILWVGYGLATDNGIITLISVVAYALCVYVLYEITRETRRFGFLILSLLPPLIVVYILINKEVLTASDLGYAAVGAAVLGLVSILYGLFKYRDGLYPVSGTISLGTLFAGIIAVLYSLAELGELIPFIMGAVVAIYGVLYAYPFMFPAVNKAAADLSINSDPARKGSSGVANREALEKWARDTLEESNRVKADRKRKREEKKSGRNTSR